MNSSSLDCIHNTHSNWLDAFIFKLMVNNEQMEHLTKHDHISV